MVPLQAEKRREHEREHERPRARALRPACGLLLGLGERLTGRLGLRRRLVVAFGFLLNFVRQHLRDRALGLGVRAPAAASATASASASAASRAASSSSGGSSPPSGTTES